jgi:hypothetical protein
VCVHSRVPRNHCAGVCRTFTLGQAAGSGGTVRVKNFTRHLPTVLELPDANTPIPYVDLLWAGVPTHRDSKAIQATPSADDRDSYTSPRKATLSASGVTSTDPSDPVEQDVPVVDVRDHSPCLCVDPSRALMLGKFLPYKLSWCFKCLCTQAFSFSVNLA